MDVRALAAEFPRAAVHWRVQGSPFERNGKHSAMALAYIDARDVMDRLDEVCGPENWQDEYVETVKGRIICRLGVKVGDTWVWKSDGAGETAVEGDKGGISDALKRAAVHWGIGRYLYRLDSPWVACGVRVKGSATYWKAWAEDPWSKVKTVGYTQPAPKVEAAVAPKADAVAPAAPAAPNTRKVADDMIAAMKGAKNANTFNAINDDPKFCDDYNWLDANCPPQAAEVMAAIREARLRTGAGEKAA